MSARKYSFTLNGETFDVAEPHIDGLQVRLLAQLGSDVSIIIEDTGDQADRVISDTDKVSLDGQVVHFYAKPPTVFGR